MEGQPQAPPAAVGGRREPSTDPVKAQGILESVNKKNKYAALLWPQRWSFFSHIREIQEEEAQKMAWTANRSINQEKELINFVHGGNLKTEATLGVQPGYVGLSLEEYRNAVRSVSCTLEPQKYPVIVDPSPKPLPRTSSGIIGRRATCPLERYGRLVKTARDYPARPPLKPGQIYDPYKQTIVFLGSVDGDPISFKMPPSRTDNTEEMWSRPLHVSVSPFDNIIKNV